MKPARFCVDFGPPAQYRDGIDAWRTADRGAPRAICAFPCLDQAKVDTPETRDHSLSGACRGRRDLRGPGLETVLTQLHPAKMSGSRHPDQLGVLLRRGALAPRRMPTGRSFAPRGRPGPVSTASALSDVLAALAKRKPCLDACVVGLLFVRLSRTGWETRAPPPITIQSGGAPPAARLDGGSNPARV